MVGIPTITPEIEEEIQRLCHGEEMSLRQIAKKLGLSIGCVQRANRRYWQDPPWDSIIYRRKHPNAKARS